MPKIELNIQAPAFKMEDYQGKSVDITEYQGQKNVLLVFNRGFS